MKVNNETTKENASSPAPTVFMSYSHDSPEHKAWVAGLATDLRRHSVDAILDQWRLRLGMDVPSFMERGIRDSNRVCIVCTPEYARKADAGVGGVGYEKMIVTGELYKDLGSEKFVPVLANGDEEDALPSFLKGRFYVDFRNAQEYAAKLEDLVRALLEVPRDIEPPLGPNPFEAGTSGGKAPRRLLGESVVRLPDSLGLTPEAAYDTCQELFRRGDTVGWTELVKKVKIPIESNLIQWRGEFEKRPGTEKVDLFSTVDEAVNVVSPVLALALASVESRQREFIDQRSVVDDFIQVSQWARQPNDLMRLAGMLEALVYVYHYLHGATAIQTNQLEVALRFATMRVNYEGNVKPLWKHRSLVGWPDGFERNNRKAWDYIVQAPERISWLTRIFPRERDYPIALGAYCMVLTALECGDLLAQGKDASDIFAQNKEIRFDVPPMFAYLPRKTIESAFPLAFRDRSAVESVASAASVEPGLLRKHWRDWNAVIVKSIPPGSPMWPLDIDDIFVGELP